MLEEKQKEGKEEEEEDQDLKPATIRFASIVLETLANGKKEYLDGLEEERLYQLVKAKLKALGLLHWET